MSFLFKSSKKNSASGSTSSSTPANALPPATRDIRSSDGPSSAASQIPTLNGVVKPGSPTPGAFGSVNTSLNSLADGNGPVGGRSGTVPQQDLRQEMFIRSGSANGSFNQQEGAGMGGVGGGSGTTGSGRPGVPSPEQKTLRDRSQETQLGQRLPIQQSRPPPQDASPYPWSQKRLTFTVSHTNPFPRYGPAVNATSSKEGAVYLMGGLINGSTVKGDLWMVEAGVGSSMSCYPVATTSEGPGPRVGHASLLVGNAFIVFGGDTKMDEGDNLDDTLYLLNTSTKQWSRALPAGPRPPGRYGHTLNILGSKIYIFGGQVEGYFFNDLVAFDLNALQQASNRWEILIQNTIDGGPPHGQIPPARTNHTMVSWNDRLYLFGGTDGVQWFNDVWCYSPHTNSWTQLECIGYIPSPREGHAASLVGDVMYIFGGRTESGDDLGDLAAFRIGSRRWYTFQNMGPSPSPRSGHSMTTVGKSIVILAGEPSSAPRDPVELGLAYFLDTAKIRYPPDSASQTPASDRVQGTRRPSGEKGVPVLMGPGGGQGSSPGRQGSAGQGGPAELMDRSRVGSGDATNKAESTSRLPRIAGGQAPSPAPTGPPPQAPGQQGPRTNGMATSRQPTRPPERALSPANEVSERARRFENPDIHSTSARASPAPMDARVPTSPTFTPSEAQPSPMYFDTSKDPVDAQSKQGSAYKKVETYQPSQDQSAEGLLRRSSSRGQQQKDWQGGSSDMMNRLESETPRQSVDKPAEPEQLPKVRQLQQADSEQQQQQQPQDSGIGSSPALSQQYDEMAKELDGVKQRSAWLASELALARRSGYTSRASADSPVLDERAADVFADDDKPLVEALLKMRGELARVQSTIDEQAKRAAERIGDMERQRDAAVQEAVFAKARLAGQGSGGENGSARATPDTEREGSLGKRLAASLAAQGDLSRRIEGLVMEVEGEKKARGLAEDTAQAAEKRAVELDQYRQTHSSEIESLRSELHEAQTQAREVGAAHAEVQARHQMLVVDRDELSGKLETSVEETKGHTDVLEKLREAVQSSTEKAEMLEQKLEQERGEKGELDQEVRRLKSELESRGAELESAGSRLKDAEEMAEKHREEARTHREAVLAGLGKINERSVDTSSVADERVGLLQQQVESAHALVRQNQGAADSASEKLRRAEERIAGLEAYQEQASREGLSIRKQLQQALKEHNSAREERVQAEQNYQSQMLETNALAVQHASLKDILAERGINPAEVRKSRAVDSPSGISHRFSTPDLARVREVEAQLEASLKSHDEMKAQFEEVGERDERMKREYEEKLAALDNDHQAAVKYLRGTEKMLSKMKQELQRVKNENGELRRKADRLGGGGGSRDGTPTGREAEWEERIKREVETAQADLRTTVEGLESRLQGLQGQLDQSHSELEDSRHAQEVSQAELTAAQSRAQADLEGLRQANEGLEARARDAENKVQVLLDQVESSVDSYRRHSRMPDSGVNGTHSGHHRYGSSRGGGHARNLSVASSEAAAGPRHIPLASGAGHRRQYSEGAESMLSSSPSASASAPDFDAGAAYHGFATGQGNGAGNLGGLDEAEAAGRNSLALDSLASELDALRSQWEVRKGSWGVSGAGAGAGGSGGREGRFDFGGHEGEEGEDEEGDHRGYEDHSEGATAKGHAVTTPGGMI